MGTATAIVKQAYEAFGRGDVPAILNLVADEVDWELVGPTNLPYAGRRKNHKEVADFFAAVAHSDDYMPSSRANLSRPTSMSPCWAGRKQLRVTSTKNLRANGFMCSQ